MVPGSVRKLAYNGMEHPKRTVLTQRGDHPQRAKRNETKLAFWLQVAGDVLTRSILISMKDKPRVLYLQEKSEAK